MVAIVELLVKLIMTYVQHVPRTLSVIVKELTANAGRASQRRVNVVSVLMATIVMALDVKVSLH